MTTDTSTGWADLLDQVPRSAFIPDTIWVDDPHGAGFVAVSRAGNPQAWLAAVSADAPVITQINFGRQDGTEDEHYPSSSSSQPSIVANMLDALDPRPGHSVLEIGTGTGWNAALLADRVGTTGRVTTVEIDPIVADAARHALAEAGFTPQVITGDGANGCAAMAPYDRIIATASVRELVPAAWLRQLCPGGRLVVPWGTDYGNGALLTLDLDDGTATGRFSGNLAFMRLRNHQRSLFGWEPDEKAIATAETGNTDVRGNDLDMMLNPDKGRFAIGTRLGNVALVVSWDAPTTGRHVIELDDLTTHSYARLEADMSDPAPFTVRQLGPRRLWDEAVHAYDWWYEHGKPGPERFGLTVTTTSQTVWLDTPETAVRTWRL